jgi:hypothetical protein
MSKIIVESNPCDNDGYTMITIKGQDSDEIARRILAAVAEYEIERKRKEG